MNIEKIKTLRLIELDKKYEPIIQFYNNSIDIVKNMHIEKDDSIEIVICKIYILTNNVNKTLKILSDSGYRINNRKINSHDISETLKGISKTETNWIKKFAKKLFMNNKKRIT